MCLECWERLLEDRFEYCLETIVVHLDSLVWYEYLSHYFDILFRVETKQKTAYDLLILNHKQDTTVS